MFESLFRAGKRLVFVDTLPPPSLTADYVGTAKEAAARRCADHLIERGHRDIAFLAERDDTQVSAARARGCRRAMSAAGLEPVLLSAAFLMPIAEPPPTPSGRFADRTAPSGCDLDWAHRLVRAALALEWRPTALFADCNVLAHSVGGVLGGYGLRVPEDVALVGFDDLARWEGGEDLSTARQDFEGVRLARRRASPRAAGHRDPRDSSPHPSSRPARLSSLHRFPAGPSFRR